MKKEIKRKKSCKIDRVREREKERRYNGREKER